MRTCATTVTPCPPPLLSSDVDKIHDGIGDKVALLIQWVATFVGGFVVAFIEDYRLTLLLLTCAPLLIVAGYFMTKVWVWVCPWCVCVWVLCVWVLCVCVCPCVCGYGCMGVVCVCVPCMWGCVCV